MASIKRASRSDDPLHISLRGLLNGRWEVLCDRMREPLISVNSRKLPSSMRCCWRWRIHPQPLILPLSELTAYPHQIVHLATRRSAIRCDAGEESCRGKAGPRPTP